MKYRLMLLGWNLRDRAKSYGSRLASRMRRQEGQGSLEYVMIIALVVIVIFSILWLLKDQLMDVVNAALKKIKAWVKTAKAQTA